MADTTQTLLLRRSPKSPSRGRRILRNWDVVIAALVVLLFTLFALVPGLFTSYDPIVGDTQNSLAPPSSTHWFGTDEVGRDLYSRVVYGSRVSILAALFAVAIGFVVGGVLGLLAGTFGGVLDTVVSTVFDSILALPGILITLAVLAAFGNGTLLIAVGVGIGSLTSFGRVMRSEVMRIRDFTFVEAAISSGAKIPWVIARHILPNTLKPMVALATLQFGTALLAIGSMGFLGFGQEPPNPEWGQLIAQGQTYINSAWWVGVLPGLAFTFIVMSVNRVSKAIDHS